MESPHMYDSADQYKKGNYLVKNKTMYSDVDYSDLNGDLTNNEISLDLNNLIDDPHQQHFVSENLIAELQGLNMEKSSLGLGVNCPRGMGANPGMPPTTSGANIYNNTLPYIPQPVHGGSSHYDRHPIKEEPNESHDNHEYPSCARMNYSGYGVYPMTPTVVPGSDHNLLKSPLKSPGLLKNGKSPKSDKSSDEYRRRRERNNIAVRKSREKAKLRTRETEERVKLLTDENRKLQEQCKALNEEVSMFRSMFSNMDLHRLPEAQRSEVKNRIEGLSMQYPQHQHLLGI